MKNYYIFGDSLLRGVMPDEKGMYHSTEYIGFAKLSKEYNVGIENFSMPTFTVKQGYDWIQKTMQSRQNPYAAIIEFGGNDCDYAWSDIMKGSRNYENRHRTSLMEYLEYYNIILEFFIEKNVVPIVTMCPPFPEKVYKEHLLSQGVSEEIMREYAPKTGKLIEEFDSYRDEMLKLAVGKKCLVLNLRPEFEKLEKLEDYYSIDGMHPNEKGYELIHNAFSDFFKEYES